MIKENVILTSYSVKVSIEDDNILYMSIDPYDTNKVTDKKSIDHISVLTNYIDALTHVKKSLIKRGFSAKKD